jgi:hypothetical protein
VSLSSSGPPGLAFKAYEIEELADVYFFRRCGIVVAHAARAGGLSPNMVSILAGAIGGVGGALLASERLAPAGVACLFLYGIFDSADGQLARMTGQTSEFGRLLDGLAGYVAHTAAYLGIVAAVISRGGSWSILGWAAAAGLFTALHAQMYDYHRTAYAAIVVRGVPTRASRVSGRPSPPLIAMYEAIQRRLAGRHPEVEALIAARSPGGGQVRMDDRARYRSCFYRPVRGWNLLGDNVRRYAFAVLAVVHHLDWMFAFILLPVNLVLAAMWLWQRRADRQFLDATASAALTAP